MEALKKAITTILSDESQVDWLIIHKISKSVNNIDGIEFSFVNGIERVDEPFKTNQGYISIKNPTVVKEFERIISELINDFISNQIALANINIIIARASYQGEDKEILLNYFKNKISGEDCQRIFNILIDSLNKEYYKHDQINETYPKNTNNWLSLFHSTQYLHSISDPLLPLLHLVRAERNRELNFELLEKMNPLLRSVLLGQYGFDLKITKSKLEELFTNEKELIFLSACLIDDSAPNKISPDWLSQDLINLFINKHWKNIGSIMFVHVFGLSYRNKNRNNLYKNLEGLIHNDLIIQIKSDQLKIIEWINTLSFPNDFIALFTWFSIKKIEYGEIDVKSRKAILRQFINELRRIIVELPIHLASPNSTNPFNSFQLHESKYQDTLTYLLLFILDSNSDNLQDFKRIGYDIKPLFYGSFRSISLAKHFTEIMLLIALSGSRINGINDTQISNLKKYLKILSETILIPYIHLSERDDEIWNPETEKPVLEFNAGKFLLNNAIVAIKKHAILKSYHEFFEEIDNVKIARWPYETAALNK